MRVLLRTEINPSVAAGHAMRCLSLAEALLAEGAEVAIMCEASDQVRDLAAAHGVDYHPLAEGCLPVDAEDARASLAAGADIVVADSPKLTQPWADSVRAGGRPLVYLAGAPGPGFLAADGCLWPEACPQHVPAGLNIRCGLESVILSSAYWPRDLHPRPGPVRRVLVTTGGADHYNLCSTALRVLDALPGDQLEIRVVIGAFFVQAASVKAHAARSRHRVECLNTPRGIKDLLEWADLAISGGGGTLYEMATRGVPGLGIAIWPLQAPTVAAMAEAGAVLPVTYDGPENTERAMRDALGTLLTDAGLRARQAECGPRAIDGQGALRAARWILDFARR